MLITAIGAFLGALLSILGGIYLEYVRKPNLIYKIEDPPEDRTFNSSPANQARFLRVHFINIAMPKHLAWLSRYAGMHCHGEIQFCYLEDAAPVFSKSMPLRWSESDEPLSPQLDSGGKITYVFDVAKYRAAFYRNCYPGSKERIDVAGRFDNDDDCYGWCNDTYIKGWRNPEWKLSKGRYYVKITIHSSGDKVIGIFKLDNATTRENFRLLTVSAEEYKRLS